MIGTLLKIVFGFVVASLAAGLVLVGFVITPLDLAQLSGESLVERLGSAGLLALAAATHSAIFAAPFALIGALIGEWSRYREWTYFAFVGIAIGVAGFLAQHASEAEGEPTILNTYALAAYASAGLVAGIAYWAVAGRFGRRDQPPPAAASGSGIAADGIKRA